MSLKFSIILPVYNVEKFLPDCLDSLYCQNIPEDEYEIICVVDGSPDHSAEVIQKYQQEHANLILLQQENSGVCVARNRGFEQARGEYVWFIDPDDMIASNCLKKIYSSLQEDDADIFEMLNYQTCPEGQTFEPKIIDFQIDGENNRGSHGSGCLSVCRREYLLKHHITFNPKLRYGEDYLWALQTKYRKHKSIYTITPLYIYRQRAGSAMHSSSPEKVKHHMTDMLELGRIYRIEYLRCKQEGFEQDILSNIQWRQHLCTESALFCFMKLKPSFSEVKTALKEFQHEGIYPYPLMTWKFCPGEGFGPIKFRLFTFLFPIRLYYLMICLSYRAVR